MTCATTPAESPRWRRWLLILAGLAPAVLLAAISLLCAQPAAAAAPDWVHQLGTAGLDAGQGSTAVDSAGNLYATGATEGTLPGSPEPNAGNNDIFIASWDSTGATRWVHQLGTTEDDFGQGVAVDAAGNVYAIGISGGTLPGSPDPIPEGTFVAFVASWDSTGTTRWIRQLTGYFSGEGVAVDATGNVYVTGYTFGPYESDVFVASLTSTGTTRWIQTLGTSVKDEGADVATDSAGNVYVTGLTKGTLPGSPEPNAGEGDVFVASWDSTGAPRWVHQLGTTEDDIGQGVAVDAAGNVFASGFTEGTLPGSAETHAGLEDAFIASWTSTGTQRWVHQLGSALAEHWSNVTVDAAGKVFTTGITEGTLPGSSETNAGGYGDVFVASWDNSGTQRWVHQLGTSGADAGWGVSVDVAGNVYVTGYSDSTLPGSPEPNAGSLDIFIAKWGSGTPPPADTVAFTIAGAVNYTNSQSVTAGGFSITRDAYGIRSVAGTATIPSSVSGNATVTVNVSRFFNTQAYTGSIQLNDPGAGVSLNHPINSRVYPVSTTGATNTQRWTNFNRTPWRPYWLTWTIHDLA